MSSYKILSSSDLLKLPNFRDKVDHNSVNIDRIEYRYNLRDTHKCGLCGQVHKEGYILKLLDKSLTAIGHICGKKHYGERFIEEKRRYDDTVLRPQLIRKLSNSLLNIRTKTQELDELARKARLLGTRKQGINKRLPSLYKELVRRAYDNNTLIKEQIELTDDEVNALYDLNPNKSRESYRYKEQSVGHIKGLRIFAVNIQESIIKNLVEFGHSLAISGFSTLLTKEIIKLNGLAEDFDNNLANAYSIIAAGDSFFTKENYRLLSFIATVPAENKLLSVLDIENLTEEIDISSNADLHISQFQPKTKRLRDIEKKLQATLRKH